MHLLLLAPPAIVLIASSRSGVAGSCLLCRPRIATRETRYPPQDVRLEGNGFAAGRHEQGRPRRRLDEVVSLGAAANGSVLDMQGKPGKLHQFLGDKFVIMSFIYTHCDDINGCPLATYVSSQVQNRLLDEKQLRERVRFISMSFDPVNDPAER